MAPRTALTPDEPKAADLEMQLAAANKRADEYRIWWEEHQTLLAYACNLVTGQTALNRDIVPVDDHPEGRREVAVEDGNAPGRWRLASYGFDSDVAKLFEFLKTTPPVDPDAH